MTENSKSELEMAKTYVRNMGFKAEIEVRRFIEKTPLSFDGKTYWEEVLRNVIALLNEKRTDRLA
jgi:hypothetical protein